ncbi:fructose-specific PTS transporter subunit EIIC [Oceanobacillus sp. FSL W8-0428]|uniref:PTS galactitol transporter subunit IIC n=1 Tax=Oceanobacillus sojae TaxID=582851 RepID=A0A511ZK39_9BACI|nr:fructose-specific PTS transporter subunit EIIC [Oceanobacillus sojae]GEN87817.1 PTS galactitol transporter subunit IIC [Oceanobacillus sojae]
MSKVKIVAATGCPTGIAHTFMAAEALISAAEKLGAEIKVETHGQVGIENQLTKEEIQQADGVIIAADKDVLADRFSGKPTIDVSVSKAIKDPETLIQAIINGEAKIYRSSNQVNRNDEDNEEYEKKSIGRIIYQHLMNGISHMLPFVVGGGVLIALSFLFGINSADQNDPSYSAFAAFLNNSGSIAFSLMLPMLAGYIASSISQRSGLVAGFIGGMIADQGGAGFLGALIAGFLAGYLMLYLSRFLKGLPESLNGLKAIFILPLVGIFAVAGIMTVLVVPMSSINTWMQEFVTGFQGASPILLGIIVGCMGASDLGGPINKAAYVTALALLADGNYYFMAGVFSASMTPPLITAFAVIFFKRYFNQSDRSAGIVNFVLGSTQITEGAIPFAAKNPVVMIPIFMIGSSISTALTYLMAVQIPAPHGGFLILPVATNGLLWIACVLIGSIIGSILYGFYQKRTFNKRAKINISDQTERTEVKHVG